MTVSFALDTVHHILLSHNIRLYTRSSCRLLSRFTGLQLQYGELFAPYHFNTVFSPESD